MVFSYSVVIMNGAKQYFYFKTEQWFKLLESWLLLAYLICLRYKTAVVISDNSDVRLEHKRKKNGKYRIDSVAAGSVS
jgi:hypothetical protein